MIAYLGLGSNLGKKVENIERAISLLQKREIKIKKKSLIYKTEPVEYGKKYLRNKVREVLPGEWFLNTVVEVETVLSARNLLNSCQEIERELGRKRSIKWGPRTMDMDILFYGNEIIKDKDLIIPHSEMHRRRFILVPLVEINPDFIHPILNVKVKEILEDLKDNFKVCKWNNCRERENE